MLTHSFFYSKEKEPRWHESEDSRQRELKGWPCSSGLEGLFFSSAASKAAGFEKGGDYQRQSAMAYLVVGLMSIVVYFSS